MSNESPIDLPSHIIERNQSEKEFITKVGDHMGYGRVMQLCEEIWREKAISMGLNGSEHTTGPCGAFMVPCTHPVKDNMGHCDICCGAGRITKGVAKLLLQSCDTSDNGEKK